MGETVTLICTALGGAVVASGTIYAAVIKGQLTKVDHDKLCDSRQEVVFTILKSIQNQLDAQDKKLDRLLFNQNGGGSGKPTPTT